MSAVVTQADELAAHKARALDGLALAEHFARHRSEAVEELVEVIGKVRDGYASQAKFADPEPAAYYREFVRRIDAALKKHRGEQG